MSATGKPISELLTRWEDAVGSVLETVTEETSNGYKFLILRFTHGRCVVLSEVECDDCRRAAGYSGDPDDLSGKWDKQHLVYFGLYPADQYEREQAEEKEAWHRMLEAQREAAERREFERLSRKYGME